VPVTPAQHGGNEQAVGTGQKGPDRLRINRVGVWFYTYGRRIGAMVSSLRKSRGELRVNGEYVVIGLIALGLLVYLSYVLLRPEKF
jgi:K+-transporting ATPase KdpF subunit